MTQEMMYDVRTSPSDLRSFREALTLLASLRRSLRNIVDVMEAMVMVMVMVWQRQSNA